MLETTWGNWADSTSADVLTAPRTRLWQSRKDSRWNWTPPSCGFSTDGLETLIKSLNVSRNKFSTLPVMRKNWAP